MEQFNYKFIEFMVETDVLKFGELTLKERKEVSILHERRRICDRHIVS